jgi:hypothetical protein
VLNISLKITIIKLSHTGGMKLLGVSQNTLETKSLILKVRKIKKETRGR